MFPKDIKRVGFKIKTAEDNGNAVREHKGNNKAAQRVTTQTLLS